MLLCVPDGEIAAAAAAVPPGPLVGHCSGATGLDVLAPHEAFSLHPLMTVTAGDRPDALAGAGAAIAGSTPAGPGLRPRARPSGSACGRFELADGDRAAYHAAASIASNFLVTLEAAAERLAAAPAWTASCSCRWSAPRSRTGLALGPERALTGPVARGDERTVAAPARGRRRAQPPSCSTLFDALVEQSHPTALAAARRPPRRRLA